MRRIVVVRRKRPGRSPRRILATGKAFLYLSFGSMIVFLLLGLGGIAQNSLASSPVQSMKGLAASLSSNLFSSLLGMELPHMAKQEEGSSFSAQRTASFLVRFLTDLNPDDPKSLLELGMPGIDQDKMVLLRPGSGGHADDDLIDHDPEIAVEDAPGVESDPKEGGDPDAPAASEENPPATPSPNPAESGAPDEGTKTPVTDNAAERKVVFVYHSHNRESYYPELKDGAKLAESGTTNVTKVGERLASQLEKLGVGAAHSEADYMTAVKDYNYNFSYKYSLATVKEAMAVNKGLQMFFDIHRDDQKRGKTTTTIKGKDYAQVFFVIGLRNPNWKKNEAFANKINEALEKDYPTLSRGILGKNSKTGVGVNGEYNQSVSPDSVLIEIGGVDNTLEECYRTADALAKVISEIYWEKQDAVQVSGHADKAAN
ncbi:stage II sporulation protein P [Cohnella sp. AR92]|uniref:stage II sporulation protein P n=1 Tax=Cohnella sp. AR92 TaxID=648716 RepID=UPI000F8D81C9|nr:stage II sporulation protein P [Cohnella sp. AR92]RUS48520.1 stage II sporulation protein P [Cohnella sp. AR92]